MQTNQILIFVVMGAAFYFLLLRPQQKQAKRQAETIASLTPGTRIVTIGGIYATVVSIDDDRVRVAVADGSEFEIIKRAVGSVLPDEDDQVDAEDDDESEPLELEESPAEGEAPAPADGFTAAADAGNEGTSTDA
jgi:preprotein translocase subunit YajC